MLHLLPFILPQPAMRSEVCKLLYLGGDPTGFFFDAGGKAVIRKSNVAKSNDILIQCQWMGRYMSRGVSRGTNKRQCKQIRSEGIIDTVQAYVIVYLQDKYVYPYWWEAILLTILGVYVK